MEKRNVCIENFLLHCKLEKSLSEKTLKAYKIDLTQYQRYLLTNTGLLIEATNRDNLRSYINILHGLYKVKSVKRKIATLKSFFSFLEDEDINYFSPFRKLKIRIKEPFRLPIVLGINDIQQIFSAMYREKNNFSKKESFEYKVLVRDAAILELLFATGLRVSELVGLQKNVVNISEGFIKVVGKGNKERIIHICHGDVWDALKEYYDAFGLIKNKADYIFINRLGRRMTEQSVRNLVKKYARLGNIDKHVTPHTYRHSLASNLLNEGVDIRHIQVLLGHSSIITTQMYTHISNVQQREVLAIKHPRNRVVLPCILNAG